MPALSTVGKYRTNLRRRTVAVVVPEPVDQGEFYFNGIVLKDAITGEKIVLKDNDLEITFVAPAGGETEVTSIILGDGNRFYELTYDSADNTVDITTVDAQDYYSSLKLNSTVAGTHIWEAVRYGETFNTLERIS